MKNNLFIALEGIDGSGKTTQIHLLAEKLSDEGHQVYTTFEPTDNFIGSIIRDILKGVRSADHKTIAALFAADRLDHVLNADYGMVTQLNKGYTVITDRYYFSSYAYHGTHVDMDWVIDSNAMVARTLRPNLTIFIDVAPRVAMQRINANRKSIELFETLENLSAVKNKYMEAFQKMKGEEHVVIVDGDRTPIEVAEAVWIEVLRYMNK